MVLAKLIGIVIIIIIVLIGITYLSQTIVDLTTAGRGLLDALRIDIKPQQGELVCDLSLTVLGELHGSIIEEANIKVGAGTQAGTAKRYQWIAPCHEATSVPFFALIDNSQSGLSNLNIISQTGLDLISTGDTIEVQAILRDSSGQQRASDVKYENIPAGFVGTPRQIQKTFIFTNLPERNYTLEIYFNHPTIHIDGLPAGSPFLDRVCKSTLTTC